MSENLSANVPLFVVPMFCVIMLHPYFRNNNLTHFISVSSCFKPITFIFILFEWNDVIATVSFSFNNKSNFGVGVAYIAPILSIGGSLLYRSHTMLADELSGSEARGRFKNL